MFNGESACERKGCTKQMEVLMGGGRDLKGRKMTNMKSLAFMNQFFFVFLGPYGSQVEEMKIYSFDWSSLRHLTNK